MVDLLLTDKADEIADKEKTEWGEKWKREKNIKQKNRKARQASACAYSLTVKATLCHAGKLLQCF